MDAPQEKENQTAKKKLLSYLRGEEYKENSATTEKKSCSNLRINNRKRAKTLDYSTDTLFIDELSLIILAILIGAFLIAALFVNLFIPFKEERDYIKMEMARALDKEEYVYWKSKLKMLYISKIPIVRSIAARRKYKR